jgi:hypothetical protein
MRDMVRLPGFARPFAHVKIQLDPQDRGRYVTP